MDTMTITEIIARGAVIPSIALFFCWSWVSHTTALLKKFDALQNALDKLTAEIARLREDATKWRA